ncbi:hypothetical protein, partial [Devosia insulae]|uniref:hypothetical protein n=1 Tax=Devosia insulae TaxID=408174 RepID=UPI001AED0B06
LHAQGYRMSQAVALRALGHKAALTRSPPIGILRAEGELEQRLDHDGSGRLAWPRPRHSCYRDTEPVLGLGTARGARYGRSDTAGDP